MKKVEVGGVYGFRTKDVINHQELFKWHFCVCDETHQYLFVCEACYQGDFALPLSECSGLEYDVSYISLGRALFRPKVPNRAKEACVVSVHVLRRLYEHIAVSEEMSEIDKRKVLPGLARRISRG